jgi:RNA recognition motif-containing protein
MSNIYKSNIFVKNVPKDVTLEQFEQKMATVGTILKIKLDEHFIYVNNEKICKNKKGYVLYEDVKQAQKCIQKFHESHEFGYGRPIEVDFWRSKNDIKQ